MPRRIGRPKGEGSTGVNVRLPVSLVQRLDRYLDRLGKCIFPVQKSP
jgi:hypothetical protein